MLEINCITHCCFYRPRERARCSRVYAVVILIFHVVLDILSWRSTGLDMLNLQLAAAYVVTSRRKTRSMKNTRFPRFQKHDFGPFLWPRFRDAFPLSQVSLSSELEVLIFTVSKWCSCAPWAHSTLVNHAFATHCNLGLALSRHASSPLLVKVIRNLG